MKSRDFCYWLQGYFEISRTSDGITAEQLKIIHRHLNMVFAHEVVDNSGWSGNDRLLKC